MRAYNKKLQSDSATCHLFCNKNAKQAPDYYAVELGVILLVTCNVIGYDY
jgi:hypothetical protein